MLADTEQRSRRPASARPPAPPYSDAARPARRGTGRSRTVLADRRHPRNDGDLTWRIPKPSRLFARSLGAARPGLARDRGAPTTNYATLPVAVDGERTRRCRRRRSGCWARATVTSIDAARGHPHRAARRRRRVRAELSRDGGARAAGSAVDVHAGRAERRAAAAVDLPDGGRRTGDGVALDVAPGGPAVLHLTRRSIRKRAAGPDDDRRLGARAGDAATALSGEALNGGAATADAGGDASRRLIAPRKLEPNQQLHRLHRADLSGRRECRPRAAGGRAGPRAGLGRDYDRAVQLPVYYHFRFQTGPGGDFASLARQIMPPAAQLDAGHSGRSTSSAPGFGAAAAPGVTLQFEGALRTQNERSDRLAGGRAGALRDAVAQRAGAAGWAPIRW